ncbi:uncharacterized protein HD556DRAFT_1351215 [Suillus plorans]|uniref:Uncharacterized protein n=1 Tax=Suillus plorans TaxID=116603 RepID=A0A9P7DMM8_9AGAM|nr:uncharacterized protein HD556DRAFT_1351215 [Suillus plorans]KAG1798553.1 hypothetical protein HD556DRAFT_1351215 [Suillus plorans]
MRISSLSFRCLPLSDILAAETVYNMIGLSSQSEESDLHEGARYFKYGSIDLDIMLLRCKWLECHRKLMNLTRHRGRRCIIG